MAPRLRECPVCGRSVRLKGSDDWPIYFRHKLGPYAESESCLNSNWPVAQEFRYDERGIAYCADQGARS